MTESDWLRCHDYRPMLAFLAGKLSRRKGTLYVCAGLRCIWDLLYNNSSRKAVETAERAADGKATQDEIGYGLYAAETPTFGYDFEPHFILEHYRGGPYPSSINRLIEMGVYTEADIVGEERIGEKGQVTGLINAANIAYKCLYAIDRGRFSRNLMRHLCTQPGWPAGWLVREVFGNPFGTVTVCASWLSWDGEAVPAIARKIYADKAFDHLPILADALEESGCQESAMLAHCRSGETHVRGCWVIDLLLGLK